MVICLLFILGIFIGSFLNVLVDRSESGENPFKGRSKCDYCKHKLAWSDLIPLFSFLTLNGKCRYCHKKLSSYYPVVELSTGILYVITFYVLIQTSLNFQFSTFNLLIIFYNLLIVSSLIVIFFTDLKYGIIPFSTVLFASLISIAYLFLNSPFSIINSLFAGICAFLAFLLIFLVTRGRGMGFGDVVYVFLMGLLLGFPKIIIGFYIAFVAGGLISLILVILKKKKLRGDTIPFGPFLVLGTVVSMFWGDLLLAHILSYVR